MAKKLAVSADHEALTWPYAVRKIDRLIARMYERKPQNELTAYCSKENWHTIFTLAIH